MHDSSLSRLYEWDAVEKSLLEKSLIKTTKRSKNIYVHHYEK